MIRSQDGRDAHTECRASSQRGSLIGRSRRTRYRANFDAIERGARLGCVCDPGQRQRMRTSRFVQRRRLQDALLARGPVSGAISRTSTYEGRERLGIRRWIAVLRTPTLVRYNIAWGTNTLGVSSSVRARRRPQLAPGRYVRDAYEPEIAVRAPATSCTQGLTVHPLCVHRTTLEHAYEAAP